jgi:FAD/FMN-containing dehydrogenase/Fe-S oxidoreductase
MNPPAVATLSESTTRHLAADLRRAIDGEVRFDDQSRALYATDASNYRQTPIGVVLPRSTDDIVKTVALCRRYGAPVLPRGGGTSLAGQCCNVAVVIDTSKYLNRILSLDPAARLARVEPGCVLDDLRDAAEQHHLTFGPDPSTHDHNTLGGMLGNNSCGVHSVMAGRTVDNVRSLDILTYDGLRMTVGRTSEAELASIIAAGGRRGTIYAAMKRLRDRFAEQIRARYPKIPRRVSGYNLDELLPEKDFDVGRALVGTEGTCVFILSAELELVHSPPKRAVVVLGYDDIYIAGDHVPDILAHKPIGLEGMGEKLPHYMRKKALHVDDLRLLPEGGGWLIAEFGGDTQDQADGKAHRLVEALGRTGHTPHAKIYSDPVQQTALWRVRKSGLGATAEVPGEPDTWEGWEDAAVPPAKVGPYLREFRALLDRYGYGCALYGHFGDGCIHVRINFDLMSRPGIDHYRAFIEEAADLVLRYGGSLSGEHGDGQSRAALLPKMYGPELVGAFREFKAAWDPDWKMNPGKVVDPFQPTDNLRLGADYKPALLKTVFDFADDHHDFSKAALRCVGVGECRRHSGGVMCPSYRVTREEKHSTRGRARLLFEMVSGRVLTEQWRSNAVRDALDLCLACKGCKKDCPVNVDMATYKAEFLHHYYKGRLRPREAYAMGRIYDWARAASVSPRLANFIGGAPGLSAMAKWAGGIAQQRILPAFAPQTFRAWFNRRPPRPAGGRAVILWPDTFNNHFHPEAAIAAVETLEDAGYRVAIPSRPLCCGRPLFGWGMLDRAKAQLADVLATLRPQIEQGIPVVGLEPACVASFRDELPHLFPNDPAATALAKQTVMFSELLAADESYRPEGLGRRALVHIHCHQHAVIGDAADRKLLEKLGVDFSLPDSGCCGMAGSFGFEAKHYDVAMKIGEQTLLPTVRETSAQTLVIANGFSCQEQIVQGTGRRALHMAQVARLAANLPSGSRWVREAAAADEGEHHEIQTHQ